MKEMMMTIQQENTWIRMARMGDLDAFNELVLAHQDVLFRMALWMLNDEDSAADIVQTVFLAAYDRISGYRGGTFRSWLLKMVRTICFDELHRRKHQPWCALDLQDADGEEVETTGWLTDPGISSEEALLQHESWGRIEDCLRELPKPVREVIILIDNEGLDYIETSTVLGIPLETVKSWLVRARLHLRKILQAEQQEPRWSADVQYPYVADLPANELPGIQ